VGLNIIDSFACGPSMITTDARLHSPTESRILKMPQRCMSLSALEDYVVCAATLLRDESRRAEIARNAHRERREVYAGA